MGKAFLIESWLIGTCKELEKADFADNIIYDENDRFDLNYIVATVRSFVEKAAMNGVIGNLA
jgi:hypothetical protein